MEKNGAANRGSKAVTRAVAAVLTVAFLGLIVTAFGSMLLNDGKDIVKSVRLMKNLKAYLPEKWNQLDLLSARISSFTSKISEVMWKKSEMGCVNSAFQYALGKKVVNTGAQNMIRLNTGHFYDFMEYKDLTPNAEGIIELRNTTLKDVPFLFVYEHPTLYDPDNMMPAEYAPLDHSAQMAAEALDVLHAGGIETLDSRDVLNGSGVPLNELLMVTDQHWSTKAAILMAKATLLKINEQTGANLDASALDFSRFDTITYEKRFLGKYGQRVGTGVVEPDDLVEYVPKDDVFIICETLHRNSTVPDRTEGSFPEAVVRRDRLERDEGKTYNLLGYTYYGQVETYRNFTNPTAPDFTILMLKDSYSAPMAPFLALAAREVISVDMRQDVDPLETWVEKYQPDVVVMAYSLQMLRDDEYKFG